jgi:FixJ family two-component response regulator
VVEDDEAVRKALALLLESVGLEAQCYASGEDFLRDYNSNQPGCLVLDVRMPVTNGLSVQQTLIAQGIHIPIIFITGHGDVPTSVGAARAHAMDFMEKPFNDQDLLDKIYQALEQDARSRNGTDDT